jgi:hypothetical protein
MTSGSGASPPSLGDGHHGLEDGAGLHLVNFRIGDSEPAAAMAQHRIELVQL